AAAKARPNDRVMSREATVAAAAREAVGRGEETGDQRREQAKQAKVDVSDLRPTNASERVDSGQTLANRDGGGTHQHSSNGESGSRSSGDLLGGEATRPPHGEARSLTNPTLNRAADQLSRHLQENLNSEIVRQAKFIVRTNESGEIKLHLRPESLGSVRVALQMQDGHIAGRIIVDNQTVREVFEQNLASLERAFLEQGLETGGLDVMVADSGGQGREQEETTRSRKSVADRGRSVLAGAVPTIENYDTHELVDVTV
ncbi:MAG: flagellar hook-length control protein FliK, partial [Spirochaetales bacterium]